MLGAPLKTPVTGSKVTPAGRRPSRTPSAVVAVAVKVSASSSMSAKSAPASKSKAAFSIQLRVGQVERREGRGVVRTAGILDRSELDVVDAGVFAAVRVSRR